MEEGAELGPREFYASVGDDLYDAIVFSLKCKCRPRAVQDFQSAAFLAHLFFGVALRRTIPQDFYEPYDLAAVPNGAEFADGPELATVFALAPTLLSAAFP